MKKQIEEYNDVEIIKRFESKIEYLENKVAELEKALHNNDDYVLDLLALEIKRRKELESVLRKVFSLFQSVDVEVYRDWYDGKN